MLMDVLAIVYRNVYKIKYGGVFSADFGYAPQYVLL